MEKEEGAEEEVAPIEEAQIHHLQTHQIRAKPGASRGTGGQDTLTCLPLSRVDYTGNSDEEPGRVLTATTAPGETWKAPGRATTETSVLLKL